MILDTGSPLTFVTNAAALQSGLLKPEQAKQPALSGCGGQVTAKTLAIGKTQLRDFALLVLGSSRYRDAATGGGADRRHFRVFVFQPLSHGDRLRRQDRRTDAQRLPAGRHARRPDGASDEQPAQPPRSGSTRFVGMEVARPQPPTPPNKPAAATAGKPTQPEKPKPVMQEAQPGIEILRVYANSAAPRALESGGSAAVYRRPMDGYAGGLPGSGGPDTAGRKGEPARFASGADAAPYGDAPRRAVMKDGESLCAPIPRAYNAAGGRCRRVVTTRFITHFGTRQVGELLAYLATFPIKCRAGRADRTVLARIRAGVGAQQPAHRAVFFARDTECGGCARRGQPAHTPDRRPVHVNLNSYAFTTDKGDFEAMLRKASGLDKEAEQAQALQDALRLYPGELLPHYDSLWVCGGAPPTGGRVPACHAAACETAV